MATQQGCESPPNISGVIPKLTLHCRQEKATLPSSAHLRVWWPPILTQLEGQPKEAGERCLDQVQLSLPATPPAPAPSIPSGHSFQLTSLLTKTENAEWWREDEE